MPPHLLPAPALGLAASRRARLWDSTGGAPEQTHGSATPHENGFAKACAEDTARQPSHTRSPCLPWGAAARGRGEHEEAGPPGPCRDRPPVRAEHDARVAGRRHAQQRNRQAGGGWDREQQQVSRPRRTKSGGVAGGRGDLQVMGTVALLIGIMCAVLPQGVLGQQYFNPMYRFQGQVLTLCLDPPEQVYDAETEIMSFIYPTMCQNPYIEPDVVTEGKGQLKACTHDSSIYYECKDPSDPDCLCFASCMPNEGFAPECLDVIFALEDTWGYLGVFINHGPGAPGQHLPFIGNPTYYLIFKFTVIFGELDLLDTLQKCAWMEDHKIIGDPEAATMDAYCDIVPTDLPGDWSTIQRRPIHLRYKRYAEDNFVRKMSLEISGNFEQVDPLIKMVKYKAKYNVNSNRIRSPIYNLLSYNKVPNELLLVEVSNRIDGGSSLPSTDRLTLLQYPWPAVGNLTVIIQVHDQNDPPSIIAPADGYNPPAECQQADSELPECNFGQYFSYEGTDTIVPLEGVTVSDPDLHETCPISEPECVRVDIAVRAFKGTVGLNTRSNLAIYFDGRPGSGFTARITDLNSAIKVLFYAVENSNLLGTPASSVISYNTQHSGNQEFVTVTASDQGFTGRAGTARVTSITINLVIVAVNDGPVVTSSVTEFSPTEDILGSLTGLQIADFDLQENIESSLANRNWMGKASNSPYINQMRVQVSLSFGVLKLGYTRNLQLIFTSTTMYMTISPLRFGHDVCRVSESIEDAEVLSAQLASMRGPAADAGADEAAVGIAVSNYQSICAYDNVGGSNCPTGVEPGCNCFVDGSCKSVNGKISLHLNRSRAIIPFRDAITSLLDSRDKTCAGMSIYPAPNNFTVGKKCVNDGDCDDNVLPKCIPGVTCACCANVSFVCSDNIECSELDSGSLCGCVKGGNGVCGPYFLKSEGPQGTLTTDLINPGKKQPEYGGVPCTYAGEGSGSCKSAAFAAEGTNLARIVDLVGLASLGTPDAQFYGPIVDINRALVSLSYLSDLDYNRFYRPPPALRNPFTFNIESDSLDTLVVEANDFGNSGGGPRDPRSMKLELPIRVLAVNDRPTPECPAKVMAFEDVPFHFGPPGAKPHPLRGPVLRISDPDYKDYLFDVEKFTVNVSCIYGRLFLNEEFLTSERTDNSNPNRPVQYQVGMAQEDKSGFRPGIVYNIWDGDQELKGVTYVGYDTQGAQFTGSKYIKYGNGCQFRPQCSDGSTLMSEDTDFGFFATRWYGVVYPLEGSTIGPGGSSHSCGICPDLVGNKFISIEGTFADINKALELVTYLPDPHFNTRYGTKEFITFSVNDGGAKGNDPATSRPLSETRVIEVVIDSVNDRPLVGRRVELKRPIKYWNGGRKADKMVDDYAVLAIDKKLDAGCMRYPPSGVDYQMNCNATIREFIDVDEDTLFFITPQIMWIADVDAHEAELMPVLRRYCCDEAGETACICGRVCRCGSAICSCNPPEVCEGGAGELLISLKVQQGLLSLYPPPGRNTFPVEQLTFLRNLTAKDMDRGGMMEPCPDQRACMQNVSRIEIRTTISVLQKALEQMFLTYVPKPNYYGRDELNIYVNDQGYTDDCYNSSLGRRETLNIRVVGVNDPPVIRASNEVLLYGKGEKCFYDFQQFAINTPVGLSNGCAFIPNSTRVPPPIVGPSWAFDDVDMDDTPFGNMTLVLIVGQMVPAHTSAGTFIIKETLKFSRLWYEEYRNNDGLMQLVIQGSMAEINWLMDYLAYNADDNYQGYAPFKIIALDELNFGECSGDHACGSGRSVCMDPLAAEGHGTPMMGITSKIVDVTIGAPKTCVSNIAIYGTEEAACKNCRASVPVDGVGCGWCPSACPELGGKCMIANAGGGPRFETCPSLPGKAGWNQCEPPVSNLPVLAGSLAGVFLVVIVLGYVFYKWAKRRHGSVGAYAIRKRFDFRAILRRVNLLPPEKADYLAFFLLAGVAFGLRIGIAMAGSIASYEPLCDFTQEFFIDKSSSVEMTLDNCNVNFVPVSEQGSPENTLLAVKMKMAVAKHPQIVVETSTCGLKATFAISNTKPESIRYLDYFCNIQILIPQNGFVVPALKLIAVGDNVTTIDSRPSDQTPDFNLAFGPNSFVLEGIRMVARLHKVSAKNFRFEVAHGRLTMIDLTVLETAVFESVTADMIVTSPRRSSVQFWQKEANKVCLTAAKGSMYVQDSCQEICRMRDTEGELIVDTPAEGDAASARRRRASAYERSLRRQDHHHHGHAHDHDHNHHHPHSNSHVHDTRNRAPLRESTDILPEEFMTNASQAIRRSKEMLGEPPEDSAVSTRVLGANTTVLFGLTVTDPVAGQTDKTPYVCTGDPNIDIEWTCFPYDAVAEALKEPCPPGAAYEFRKDVPQIPGCSDLEFCMVKGSSKCLCKPGCDMRGLDPPGTCNVGGQCCQIICEGYSKADMLPYEDMPRCPQTAEQPWCNGKLDQQIRFLSDFGQISFQVGYCSDTSFGNCSTFGENPETVRRVHSYQGADPKAEVSIPVDLREEDKMILNEVFHPGGDVRPKVNWFTFSLSGPGTPERTYGDFVWVSAARHLIFMPWFMDVVSYGLLSPTKKMAAGNLNPGFCPAWVDYSSTEFMNRLKVMYRVVLDTLQQYPPQEKEKIIPVGTMVVFRPVSGPPIWFGMDSKSNQPILGYVVPENYPLLQAILFFGLGLPLAAGIAGVLLVVTRFNAHVREYRRTRLLQEQTMRELSKVMAGSGPDAEDEDAVPTETRDEMIGSTPFWYILEEFIGNAEEQRSMPQQATLTVIEVFFALGPAFFVFMLNQIIEKSYRRDLCEYRSDVCKCRTEVSGVLYFTLFVSLLLDIYYATFLIDLGWYYLDVSYNLFRRITRHLLYLFISISIFFSICGFIVVLLFVIIGIMVKPAMTAPFAITIGGTALVCILLTFKLIKFQTRVQRAVTKNIVLYKSKVAKAVPAPVIDAVMGKVIKQALHANGLSVPGIVKTVIVYIICMVAIFFFIFTGFQAFTDSTDLNASLINDAILLMTVVGSYIIAVADGDANEMGYRVELVNEKIMESLQKTLDMMVAQIVTAKKAVKAMRRQIGEDTIAEDDSDSDDSDRSRKK